MAIDFSLSELVALAVESFFYGALPPPTVLIHPTAARSKNFFFVIAGIYFTLFGSSIKVLLHKRKTISGAVPLLVLAGVLGVLITWVSMTTLYVQLVC